MRNPITVLRLSISAFLIFSFYFTTAQDQDFQRFFHSDLPLSYTQGVSEIYESDHALWESNAGVQKYFENTGTNLMLSDDERDVKDMSTKERIIFGGYLGLQIGNLVTSVNVSPTVGYL